jgi:hypothetical protein
MKGVVKTSYLEVKVRVLYLTDSKKLKFAGRLLCSGCGQGLDWVTEDEITGLKTGKFGVPLCEKCERNHCSGCGMVGATKAWEKKLKDNQGLCACCGWEQAGISIPALLALARSGDIRLSSILKSQQETPELKSVLPDGLPDDEEIYHLPEGAD